MPSYNVLKNVPLLERKLELFTRGRVSCCLVPKRDDAENEKNDYNTDEGNRKGKYKYID